MARKSPSSRKRGLGRGLDALLQDLPPQSAAGAEGGEVPGGLDSGRPLVVPLDQLVANHKQPRSKFDDAELAELAESIRAQGVLQPILVRRTGDHEYLILAGERRSRAARLAGLSEVPVLVYAAALDDAKILQIALVENLQRSDLSVVEEARAYRDLREEHGLTQDEIARQVGKSRSAVANHIRLLKLPPSVLGLLEDGSLSAGQARPLLRLSQAKQQEELAQAAVEGALSAREVEALAAALLAPEAGQNAAASVKQRQKETDLHTRQAAERLTRALQTKVEIRRTARGGTVRVHFHSEDELIRLFDLFTRSEK